ncbi:xanthine dehydrogenase family protein molybdopterin-binding subunit [Chitinophaga rhizophila]|uniref:Xanthine dehydrogenase family protein molybdopterin-binding subunit n=1 Tax=Chitinophaga rhizophila TaxID=2866212 RepID=A0ABS7GH37_9BACT|nr:xanthine dehydrogenase family protein molybdopterin-binding subunit [Chitinophaga rhizophila]MBW8687009.1 xanthine dehydrogenase family protein molybdopterin-binding subunit [Chitinophaga rhizophila]
MSQITNTSRRNFLKTGAVLGSGLLISFTVPGAKKLGGAGSAMLGPQSGAAFAPNAYLHITADNQILVYLAHSEMGQGIWTTLSMLIAEELDVDVKKMVVQHGDAWKPYHHTSFGMQITGGSSTTWSEFDRYRKAGATARTLLVAAAAKKFGVSPSECKTADGVVTAGTNSATYGELASEAAALPAPGDVPLRDAKDWKYIGKSVKRLDTPAKINGTAKFGMDVQFPGMLTAAVLHAPVFGAKVKSVDAAKAKAIPGVKQVVQIPTGVAVLADNYWAAKKGCTALKVDWDLGSGVQVDSSSMTAQYKELAKKPGATAAKAGDVDSAMAKAVKTIEAEYTFPYLAHAPMEPLNVTIELNNGKCEIWCGTQMPGIDQEAAAKVLGLKPEQVRVNTVFLGGGFGRRGTPASDFVREAAEIIKASGKPLVKMVWAREDDVRGGFYRPAFLHNVKVGLNADGMPIAWKHTIVGQSIMDGTFFASMIKDGIDNASVEGVSDSPYLYAIPDRLVSLHSPKNEVPVLWWRSVGHTHTAMAMEATIDELAHAAGKDPLVYRQQLLKDHPRHLAALNLVAEKANWGKPLPEGRFRGIAVHESFLSFVAQVVEISLNTDGTIKVHKVINAIDCGLAVNPDGVKAQIESGINYGVSAALLGEITLEKGRVQQGNFNDYVVSRMFDTPAEIEVHIVDSSNKMGGVGEPGVPPVAPAIANAYFAATGKRLRDLPFNKAILKA